MTLHDSNTRINITIPKTFLQQVDDYALNLLISRSDLIRIALIEKMGKTDMSDTGEEDLGELFKKYSGEE